ncbi:NepR family anti-sigma factor [Chelatococcus sp. GCM10030263]|uniref:NepR family anti-sigma factor n=1 Tax=Chelatococcus sp. GCM10030263 TaxID=3273387 RepID=UPI00360C7931
MDWSDDMGGLNGPGDGQAGDVVDGLQTSQANSASSQHAAGWAPAAAPAETGLHGVSAHVADRLTSLYQATLQQPLPDRFRELLEKLDRGESQR